MGQLILDVIVRPFFAIWITLAVNYEKALLYFVLASISCFLIALTCFCGQWVATKLLLPIERDIYQLKRSQRNFADEHINDTRIVIDRYGNMGCLVSKGGIQNYLGRFLAKNNILQGNNVFSE